MHKNNRDYKNGKEKKRDGSHGVAELMCEQGGRAREKKWMVEEGCIEGIWCRDNKRQKNRKCKGCVEDTDADRAE
jgi:hypothetical protein